MESAPQQPQAPKSLLLRSRIEIVGFDIAAHIRQLQEPALEVASPTTVGGHCGYAAYKILEGALPPSELIVSNKYKRQNERLDLRASASALPFSDHSLGMLFASYLWPMEYQDDDRTIDLHDAFLYEARRSLINVIGIMVIRGMSPEWVKQSQDCGFTMLRLTEISPRDTATGIPSWDGIFMNTSQNL